MGDESSARKTLSIVPMPVADECHCAQRFGEIVRRDLITEVFCPVANWAALGTWLLIAPFFLHLDWAVSPLHTAPLLLPTPHPSPFEFPPYGKGRIIVCHVTLWMCNARPRAVLALLVLICSLTLSLTSIFCIVYIRGVFFNLQQLQRAAPLLKMIIKDKFLEPKDSTVLGFYSQVCAALGNLNTQQNLIYISCYNDKLKLPLEFL